MSVLLPVLLALPWWAAPAALGGRLRHTPSLDDVDATPPAGADRVSIVLPARNEAAHIAACVASLRASTWPNLEIIVVDDHSTDGTGDLARAAAAGDPRVQVLAAPDLPGDWFGKQWACHTGAQRATGRWLLFTDADTRHGPELVARMMALRSRRAADLFSVAGRQVMGTIWEQAVQPSVFTLILGRYGGADQLERASHPRDVVANGQCFLVSRPWYDQIGGHVAVRQYVAEDLMIAQRTLLAGGRVSMALGVRHLSTRMYDGLASLMKGWGKNLYAGGRHAMWGGETVRRWLYPLLLLAFPFGIVGPFLGAAIGALLGMPLLTAWGLGASLAVLSSFALANVLNKDPVWRAIYAPLGGIVLLVICLKAITRGDQVEWKGRAYTSR
ncbi:MAG: glycosyltransferase [Gemmatimonadaceae bacterium]|nr:glycosyltransferase [Gemmatimonadaceae bacterium]